MSKNKLQHDSQHLIVGLFYFSVFLFLLTLAWPLNTDRQRTSTGAQSPGVVFNGNFDTGNFGQWPMCQSISHNDPCSSYNNNHYSMRVVNNPVRQGSHAARFEVRDGDYPFCCGERAQVKRGRAETPGTNYWYSWSFMLDSNYPLSNSFQTILEWHSTQNGSPPLGFFLQGSQIGLLVHRSPNDYSVPASYVWTKQIQRGQWYDFTFNVNWSQNSNTGYIDKLYMNSVQQTFNGNPPGDARGGSGCAGQAKCYTRTIHPGDAGNYVVLGYYRDQSVSGTGIVYHDNYRVATSESALSGSTSPNPTPPAPTPTPPAPNPAPPAPNPAPTPQSPYGGNARNIPGKIEAEDFDNGGQATAYNDLDTANNGGKYRATGVDIQQSSGGGYNVGWTADGEWLEYTINNQKSGKYDIAVRVGTKESGAKMRVKLGTTTLGTIDIPNTGEWQTYRTVQLSDVNIPAGNNQVLRLEIVGGSYTLDWAQISSVNTPTPTPNPNPTPNPTTPPQPRPPVTVPGSNPTTPVVIPEELPVEEDGSVVADFNGDGLNDVARDNDGDGSINPENEIVIDGTINPDFTDTDAAPITPAQAATLVSSTSSNPLDNLSTAQKIVLGFSAVSITAFTAAIGYFVLMHEPWMQNLLGRFRGLWRKG